MLKYAKIKGFRSLGEVSPHLYQWIEDVGQLGINPEIILINAYEREPIMYKGYLFKNTKEYMPVEATEEELEDVKKCIGEVKNIKDVNEFLSIYHDKEVKDFKLDPLYGPRDF